MRLCVPQSMKVARTHHKAEYSGRSSPAASRSRTACTMWSMPWGEAHFTDENAVGTRNWLTMLPTIWPSSSVLARAEIHSGSLWKAAHFFSRSASDSQARK